MRKIRSISVFVVTFSLLTATRLTWGQAPAAPADAAAPAASESSAAAASMTATVAAVDPATRTVILQTKDNDMLPVKCGPNVRNFDQIKPGDQVTAATMDRTVIAVTKGGAAPDAVGRVIVRSQEGDKPGILIVDTSQVSDTITAVDADKRTITLKGAEGKPIKVAKDVDLASIKAGDEVSLQTTEGFALVVRPAAEAQPAAGAIKPEGGKPGEIAGDSAAAIMSATATVEAIDKEKRLVTLKGPEGNSRVIHLGENVINFDQIAVGDKVRATIAEGVALSIDKPGTVPPPAGGQAIMARAPKGSKPAVILAGSSQMNGKIQAVDAEKRTVTLTDGEGKPRTVKVGPNVDISKLKAGDEVSAQVTETVAIVVEKP
jgi:hypothetical protein